MLSAKERKVMDAVYTECNIKNPLLITPTDLLKIVDDEDISLSQLEKIMQALSFDGYFDLVYSDRHGETVYCVTLGDKGRAYPRDKQVLKRNLVFRLCLSVGFALLSFTIGLILKLIF